MTATARRYTASAVDTQHQPTPALDQINPTHSTLFPLDPNQTKPQTTTDLLLLTPDQLVAGPQGPATRRLFYLSTSRFQHLPLMASSNKYTRRDGLYSPITVTRVTQPDDLESALIAVVTNNGVARVTTDGSSEAAAVVAAALVAAGDKLREFHGQMRLSALVDAKQVGW